LIPNPSQTRKPRFKVGDAVLVIGLGTHRNKTGIVVEVVEPSTGDYVYRYRVRILDGDSTSIAFFGFELDNAA
jgi:hypothetical protein